MKSRHSQRGAIGIAMVAMLLVFVLFAALATDAARLFYQKQALQSQADLSALEIGQSWVDDDNKTDWEAELLERHAKEQDLDKITIQFCQAELNNRVWSVDSDSCKNVRQSATNALRVIAERKVPTSLVAPGWLVGDTDLQAMATTTLANSSNIVKFGIGSKLISVNEATQKDTLLSALLGRDVKLGVAGYNGLANGTVRLGDLVNIPELNVGSTEDLLSLPLDVATLLQAYVGALKREPNSGVDLDLGLIEEQLLGADLDLDEIKLGDLLNLDTLSPDEAAKLDLNALDLITGTLLIANKDHAIDLPDLDIDLLGLAGIKAGLTVGEPPQFAFAMLPLEDGETPSVKTAQLGLTVDADLLPDNPYLKSNAVKDLLSNLLDINILGLVALKLDTDTLLDGLHIGLTATASQAQMTLTDADETDLDFDIKTSPVILDLDPIHLATKLTTRLLLIPITLDVDINIKADPITLGESSYSLDPISIAELPFGDSVGAGLNIKLNLDPKITVKGNLAGLPVDLSDILGVLNPLIKTLFEDILNPLLDDLVQPLLQDVVGIQIGTVDYWVEMPHTDPVLIE